MAKMKWRSKVFYLAIALALSLSLVGGATVSANPDTEWWEEWQPEVNGPDWQIAPNSAIYDFVADSSGDIIYAVGTGLDGQRLYGNETQANVTAKVWKSEEGGNVTWDDITGNFPDSFNASVCEPWYVAIAPDNPDMVFVAAFNYSSGESEVYGSDDGGDEFGNSGFADASGGEMISSLAVSCESDDDYTIAVGTFNGHVWRLVTGGFLSGAWELIGGYDGSDAVLPGWDDSDEDGSYSSMNTTMVTSVAFSPNFDADDTILAVTTNGTATFLQTGRLGNVEQWNYVAGSAFPNAVEIVDVPPELFTVGPPIGQSTGIALSADYDGRKDDLRYAWIYVNQGDDDLEQYVGRIFQIENDVVEYAGLPCSDDRFTPLLSSISAYGTADEGKLMVGAAWGWDYEDDPEEIPCCEGVDVYYTSLPIDTCCPDWEKTKKAPTGQWEANIQYVADGDKAYATTWGSGVSDEGAFSVSEIDEPGKYWNQYSLIDTDIDYLSDYASSMNTSIGQGFIASVNLYEDGGYGCWDQVCECDSLWYSKDWGEHYMRVWCGNLTANELNTSVGGETAFIRLAPEETDWVETIYLVDRGTDTVWWNDSTGLTDWAEQSTCTLDCISDLAVADSSTIYAASGDSEEVAKSTDNGESWDDPVDADVDAGGYGHTIAVLGDNVLFGSIDGQASFSDDGGESFEALGGAGSGNVHVAFDAYFDTNSAVYTADSGGGGIRRHIIGGSKTNLNATPTLTEMGGDGDVELDVSYYGIVSMASDNCDPEDGGVLYAAYAYNNSGGNYTGAARCLTPAADLCCDEADWDYLHAELYIGADGPYAQQFTNEPSSMKAYGTDGTIYLNAIDNKGDSGWWYTGGCYYGYDYWDEWGALWGYEDCFAETSLSLVAPMPGSRIASDPCACINENFTLKWDQQCDSCLYDVQVALDEDFTETVINVTDYDPPSASHPSMVIAAGDLECSTTYYWRVRNSVADSGEVVKGFWSTPWYFAVEAGPLGAIQLTSPDNGVSNVPVDGLVFTWTSVATAEGYDFELMDSSGATVDSQSGLMSTSYTYSGSLAYDSAYTWQVTAVKGSGISASDIVSTSDVFTFRTAPEPPAPVEPPAPPEPAGTPAWVWVVIGIGAVLVITVIVLIFRTRRV
ncbi:MAG: hypothetical protein J7L19_03715 [Dehalococcoidia bacterium]|nr:hypothetical protein [Dehalococcoidia bacterium]